MAFVRATCRETNRGVFDEYKGWEEIKGYGSRNGTNKWYAVFKHRRLKFKFQISFYISFTFPLVWSVFFASSPLVSSVDFCIFSTRFECSFSCVLDTSDKERFGRTLFRASRGNVYTHFTDIPEGIVVGGFNYTRFECSFTSSPLLSSVVSHLLHSFRVWCQRQWKKCSNPYSLSISKEVQVHRWTRKSWKSAVW